ELDWSKRATDPSVPCAAVRRSICLVEHTKEGVTCDRCGGQCKEEITDRSSPLYIYTAWSDWNNHCESCSAEPKPCKAERTRSCVDRPAGTATDCEFCGGACKQQEDRLSATPSPASGGPRRIVRSTQAVARQSAATNASNLATRPTGGGLASAAVHRH